MKLRDYQRADVKRILKEMRPKRSHGALVASVVGSGKTLIGVEAMLRLNPPVVLVIAPLNTWTSWQQTCRAQGTPTLRNIASPTSRMGDPENLNRLIRREPGWYFIAWEYAARQEYERFRPGGLILDEIHRASNHSRSRTFGSFSHLAYRVGLNAEYRIGFSATPAGNRMHGLWAVARALWPRDVDLRSFWRWAYKYFHHGVVVTNSDEGSTAQQIGNELNPGKVVRSLPLYIRHEARTRCCKFHPHGVDADLPTRITHLVGVPLSPRQRQVYETLRDEMVVWIRENDWPIATNGFPLVHLLRLHQVCLAIPSTEMITEIRNGTPTELIKIAFPLTATSSKLDAMVDIIRDLDPQERILVLTHSAGIIPAAVDRIRRIKRDVAAWHGGVPSWERERIKQDFHNGDTTVIVAQIQAIGEGTDGLQYDCHSEIWLSMTDNGIANEQAMGRLLRSGQQHPVNSWQIAAVDTVESDQFSRLTRQARRRQRGLVVTDEGK